VRRPALKEMAIAVLCHPFRAFEVAFPSAPCPLGLLQWIDVQHYSRHLSPIRAFSIGIKEAKIGDEVFLVITSEHVSLRSLIVNGRIERRLVHGRLYSYGWLIKAVLNWTISARRR